MTDDDVSRGSTMTNIFTGKPFEPVAFPSRVESVIATLPTGADGADELWKLNHYYERLDDWDAAHGIATNPFADLRPTRSSSCTTSPSIPRNAAIVSTTPPRRSAGSGPSSTASATPNDSYQASGTTEQK